MDDNTQKPGEAPANLPITPPSLPSLPPRPTPPAVPVRPPFTPPSVPPAVPVRPVAPTSLPPKQFIPPTTPPPATVLPTAPRLTPPPVRPPEISLRTLKSDLASKPPFQEEGLKPTALKTGLTKIEAKPSKIKSILIVSGVAVLGVVLALAGYFVIFPYFFPSEKPAPVTTAPPVTQLPTAQDISPTPTAPSAGFTAHQSLLKISADIQTSVNISSLSTASLKQSLINEAGNRPAGTNVLKEVLLSGTAGQLNFLDAFPLLVQEFSKFEIANIFEEDFTTLLFYDVDGVWPAWVAQLKAGADLSGAKTLLTRIESANLSNLYLVSPGAATAGFKSGQVSGFATRYRTFTLKGASFNYAWVGDKLVISASFNGLKNILPKL